MQRFAKKKLHTIIETLAAINADIFVLTETHSAIQLSHNGHYTSISTDSLPAEFDGIHYNVGETRVSILTRYPIIAQHATFDSYTAVCADIATPFGVLTVHGSIVGVFGNRQPRFDHDLQSYIADAEKIFPGRHICSAGDFNVTFSGQPWPSRKARQMFLDTFTRYKLTNTTAEIVDAVDHLVFTNDFLHDKRVSVETWNTDKTLSDHAGYVIMLSLK